MRYVVENMWALLLGMLLLQVGNGLQGTLLAVRGDIEGFSPGMLSLIMSGYFVGFLGGSRVTPWMIRRVGHVRVFAALASFISAIFILYAILPNPIAWILLRVAVGFCFCGVYVVAESWLNDIATNETRGQALSSYLIVQMAGIIAAQSFVNFADPSGYELFIIISVLVSISFAPILLSVSPAPAFQRTKPMSLKALYRVSPLGCVGMFLLGSLFAALFGMSAVYATQKGLSLSDLSIFVATIYIGGLILQYPIGYISDRMDRRLLISGITGGGAAMIAIGSQFTGDFGVILILAFLMGGISNPLYSLLIAYTNDYLEHDDMTAASGGLLFLNGVGAIIGPLIVGLMMDRFGADIYFTFVACILAIIGIYAAYRMTQRPSPTTEETASYSALTPQATAVAVEVAQEIAIEQAVDAELDQNDT